MSRSHVPPGHPTVAPFLLVKSAEPLVEFLKAVFAAEETYRLQRPDGGIMNVQLRIGDSMVMIAERGDGQSNSTHVYVENVDDVYARALKAGAQSLSEPKSFFYGDRSCGVRDPLGNIWWIGTHEETVSSEEAARRLKLRG